MNKIVSIVVAVYNIDKFLPSCINSLIDQTYKDIEIILVDDGSTDNSASICDYYAQKDPRIKVIHKTNGGLSSARNAGIAIASGDFIMLVDGDDYLVINAAETLMNLIEKYNVDIIQFNYHETTKEYSRKINTDCPSPEIIKNTKVMFEKLYEIGGAAASACTKFYKKKLFKDLSFLEGIIHEDEYFTTRLLQKCKSIMYIDNNLYSYVMRQNSIVKSNFSPQKFDCLYVSKDRMQHLKNLGYLDLLEKEKSKYFINAINLWCSAKNAKNKILLKEADNYIKYIVHQHILLTKKFAILHKFCKIHSSFLIFYYLYKKLTKQI